ncbi:MULTISPECIES: hypothetical protein [unclassified Neisseria]|uniref:hypothetical protein n=1 Tax=unclassified Neisseria TaxID=2623750 RepID=UPI0010721CE2|nr:MULTISPECIES: hypothetical protein [unclassified Neisseria]MBF0802888.1 hypothetical protein [Neisseria sp. 19428wB4_WF04]TFU44425.1 hypothetical protein E4T99_00645 [Neisseria sp. WF04]
MTHVIKAGQAAKIEILNLQMAARSSLYQEWQAQDNKGSFDDFIATVRGPQVDEEVLRRVVAEVLAGQGMQPVLPRDAVAEMVAGLIPSRLVDAEILTSTLSTVLPKMSEADFETKGEISIKPGRAITKQEFDEWRKGMTAGQTAVQTDGRTLVVNDWFTAEMQADVMLEQPQLIHSRTIYDILKERAKSGMKIRMYGNFNMAKLEGVEPEIFGTDGRTPDAPSLASVVNGCQPTMILHMDNWDVDFSQCRFRVMTMMTDGYALAGYKGKNRFKPGYWLTKAVLDLDPQRRAASDWTLLGGPTGLFPPIDGTTGFAEKGYDTAGFNTTTRHKWAGNYRSNSLDTRALNLGGYGKQFPQPDGQTSGEWGLWRDGGLHGNIGSGGYIFQLPSVGQAELETASVIIENHYARGFITYGIEVGTEAKPDGQPFDGIADAAGYIPRNVYLIHTQVEDCYEGGIQANRFVNLWELHSRVYRMGHPNSGFTYYKPESIPAGFINDPGYGSSSRRKEWQINRFIIGGWYIDCARKGIDAHTISGLYIAKVRIKSKIWGIQICWDEIYTGPDEPSQSVFLGNQFTLRDSEIFAGVKGLDFTNGSFGSSAHKNSAKQRLYEMRFRGMVDNVQIYAPIGFFDNYARGNYALRDVTCTCAYPYGKLPYFNPSSSRGFWFGSQDPARRGIPFNIRLQGCTAQNSNSGNYAEAYLIQPVNLLTMRDCIADITPFTSDTVMPDRYLRGRDVVRSGIKTVPFAVAESGGVKLANTVFDNVVSVDKTDGFVIARFDYQGTSGGTVAPAEPVPESGTSAAEPSETVPAQVPQVVKFGMAEATPTVVRDDSGAVGIVMGGVNPPADWSDMADVSGSVKFVKARLKGPTASAGVYPRIKLDLNGDTDSTILMPVRVHSLGGRTSVVSLGMSTAKNAAGSVGWITDKKTDTNNIAIRVNGNYPAAVNGTANTAEARYEYGQWYILSVTAKLAGEYLNLGTAHGGNGQLDADFGEGLTVYRNHTPPAEELAAEINALKVKYGIG